MVVRMSSYSVQLLPQWLVWLLLLLLAWPDKRKPNAKTTADASASANANALLNGLKVSAGVLLFVLVFGLQVP